MIDFEGPPLFTGSTASPTFVAGDYKLSGNLGTYSGNNISLSIRDVSGPSAPTTSVTPEPSSIALLGTGLLGLAGVMRKRFA